MPRDGDLPKLEIELIPAGSRSTTSANEQGSAAGTGSNDRRRARWLLACVAAIVVALVVMSLAVDDSDTDEDVSPTTTARVEPTTTVAATTIVPTTRWTPAPNLLGVESTGLMLWSFDADSRLQWVDLDTGEVRRLSPVGGGALLPLDRGLVVNVAPLTGTGRTGVIDTSGDVLQPSIAGFGYPVPVLGTPLVWLQSSDAPRRWQLQRPGPGLILEVPPDLADSVVHYSNQVSLLVARNGTSSFDLRTRQTQFLTTTPVIAAGGGTMIGLRCNGERCVLSAIDFVSRHERTLRTDHPIDDVRDWALSPDGRYLAISRKAAGQGRFAQIIDVATSLVVWNSPDGISFAGFGPAWSWSPDSTRFFVTMSTERVIAVDVRSQPFAQTDLAIPLTPLHGIAVTAR